MGVTEIFRTQSSTTRLRFITLRYQWQNRNKVKGMKGWNPNFHVYKKTKKRVLTNLQIRQGALLNSSKSFYQNIKSFSEKLFIFSKKLCQVFGQLFSLKSPKNKENPLYLQNSSENVCRFKKKPYLCIAFETRDIGRLAQLVQSICLTSRGSAVRIRQRPPNIAEWSSGSSLGS